MRVSNLSNYPLMLVAFGVIANIPALAAQPGNAGLADTAQYRWSNTVWKNGRDDSILQDVISFKEFDGSIIVTGVIHFKRDSSTYANYPLGNSCVTQTVSKDKTKILFSLDKCSNSPHFGHNIICERTDSDTLKCTSSDEAEVITLRRVPNG